MSVPLNNLPDHIVLALRQSSFTVTSAVLDSLHACVHGFNINFDGFRDMNGSLADIANGGENGWRIWALGNTSVYYGLCSYKTIPLTTWLVGANRYTFGFPHIQYPQSKLRTGDINLRKNDTIKWLHDPAHFIGILQAYDELHELQWISRGAPPTAEEFARNLKLVTTNHISTDTSAVIQISSGSTHRELVTYAEQALEKAYQRYLAKCAKRDKQQDTPAALEKLRMQYITGRFQPLLEKYNTYTADQKDIVHGGLDYD